MSSVAIYLSIGSVQLLTFLNKLLHAQVVSYEFNNDKARIAFSLVQKILWTFLQKRRMQWQTLKPMEGHLDRELSLWSDAFVFPQTASLLCFTPTPCAINGNLFVRSRKRGHRTPLLFVLFCCCCSSLAHTYWFFLAKLSNCPLHIKEVFNRQNLAPSCCHGQVHREFSSLTL